MSDELKDAKSTAGPPPATGVFKPRFIEVEKSVDVEERFRQARRMAAGERLDEIGDQVPNMVEGQRAVAIVTPGRLIMLDPCPEPNTVPQETVAEMSELLPPNPPLTISAISYTNIEALTADKDKTRTIPFRGFLNAWAYTGHNVMVFEGHPSALEAGVRDCDVLLVDSGMIPFIQFNWLHVAQRLMRPGGRIFIHNRESYTLSLVNPTGREPSPFAAEADYVELLLRFLMRSSRSPTVEITSGEAVPDLADMIKIDVDWIEKLTAQRDKLNTDVIIDIILRRAGWRWHTLFKRTGTLKAATMTDEGIMKSWTFSVTLGKTPNGKRQIEIER